MSDEYTPITAASLGAYVGAGTADAVYVAQCFAESEALVDNLITESTIKPVPLAIRDRCVLEAGSELFHRRQAPNGIAQFATPDGAAPVRVARDPLIGVYPILEPFLPLGFA